jgi:hypothetical protein
MKETDMLNTLKTAAIATLVGISTFGSIPAHADGFYLGFTGPLPSRGNRDTTLRQRVLRGEVLLLLRRPGSQL